MKLVVGLGNPGDRYEGTRHNLGFEVIDELVDRNQLQMTQQKYQADYTIWHHPTEKVLLMKPFTYMNLSGQAVLPLMTYYGIALDDILVVHDDLDMEPGRIRFRQKGSSGGQRGIQNIIDLMGTQEFKRLKMGIGRPEPGWKVTDHVLAPFKDSQLVEVNQSIARAAEAIEEWLHGQSFQQIMQKYN